MHRQNLLHRFEGCVCWNGEAGWFWKVPWKRLCPSVSTERWPTGRGWRRWKRTPPSLLQTGIDVGLTLVTPLCSSYLNLLALQTVSHHRQFPFLLATRGLFMEVALTRARNGLVRGCRPRFGWSCLIVPHVFANWSWDVTLTMSSILLWSSLVCSSGLKDWEKFSVKNNLSSATILCYTLDC